MKVIQDTPLTNMADDKLGRENIVDLVVDSINAYVQKDHPCLVYGIYGKWGEGKTSLMNFVEEKLTSSGNAANINIIKFNPWLANNEEALLREFFQKITDSVDRKFRKVLRRYSSAAILASKTILKTCSPGLGSKLVELVESIINALKKREVTLTSLKADVNKSIVKSGKYLLVIIDDVDRLDKDELHAVLRLIRQVADFDNCIYIVAMDIDIVAKSIGEYYGTGNPQDGRKFVDKIVQVPITLPYIPKCDMQRIVENELSDVLDDCVDPVAKFEIALALTPFFSTYRELKRYCNQLQFVLPHLRGEVNISDLCLLEAIKSVNAESYHRIYEHRSQLLRDVSNVYYMKDEEQKKDVDLKWQDAVKNVVESLEGNLKEVILLVLEKLFATRSLYDTKSIIEKRLNSAVYFAKYFVQTVPSDLIPDKEIDCFANGLLDKSVADVIVRFDSWGSAFTITELERAALYLVDNCEDKLERCKVAGLLAKALSVCSLAKNTSALSVGRGSDISMFVSINLLRRYRYCYLSNEDDESVLLSYDLYADALSFIFEKAEMNFAMGVFYDLFDKLSTSEDTFKAVMPLLIERFKQMPFRNQFVYSRRHLRNLFYSWQKLDEDSWNEYARNLCMNPEASCLEILKKFVESNTDMSGIEMVIRYFGGIVETFNEKLSNEPNVMGDEIVQAYLSNSPRLLEENGY